MLLTSGDAHTVVSEQPLDSIRLREGCVSLTINRTLHMHLCGLGFGLPLFFSFVQSNRDGLVGGNFFFFFFFSKNQALVYKAFPPP